MWRIIAADDEAYIREALQKLIDWEKMDCNLTGIACDGQELIEMIEKEMPDIVITDIQMPGEDGIGVCRYMYEHYPHIPLILLTAHSEFQYARAAIRYNVCEYVLKMSIMEELPKAVEKAVHELKRESVKKRTDKQQEPETLFLKMELDIEENYKTKISLEDIATALHASGSYLSRLYKRETGKNLFDVILDKRIEAAKEYLIQTDMRTYEVSEAVGIEDSGYFSKMFKKKTGVSPKEFRKREYNDSV